MKTLKSIWAILPLHYWTGILGGVIYAIWIGLIFYLEGRWHYYHQKLLIQKIMFLMIDMPDILSRYISDMLINRAHDYANGGSVNSIPYRIVGYMLTFIFFVLVGILVGKTSNDPEREVRRRRMIKVFFIFAIFACAFWACFLVFLWAWMD